MDGLKLAGKTAVFSVVTLVWAVVGFIVGAMAFDKSGSFLLGVVVMIVATAAWWWFVLLPFVGRNQGVAARNRRNSQMETAMRLGAEDRRHQLDIANKLRDED